MTKMSELLQRGVRAHGAQALRMVGPPPSSKVTMNRPKIICISNRLPVSASEAEGSLEFQPSSGGLVTAIAPILRQSQGAWIGWPGSVSSSDIQVSESLGAFSKQSEFDLFPVHLDPDSISGFYQGFSNQVIWPLFHDLQSRCNFEPEFWNVYTQVQSRFALEAQTHIRPGDLIWVHDYHLMGLGQVLRGSEINNRICFFFHTPFPGRDIFSKLPWRKEIIESMLSYDLIGFQTHHDLQNFMACLEYFLDMRGSPRGGMFSVRVEARDLLLGCFPISIDFTEFEEIAHFGETEANALKIRSDVGVESLILSIDRLDYTKGIPYRIKAFRRLLELEPDLKRKITLLQVVVPSRIEVPEYQQLRSEIEQLVTQVNGEFGEPGWTPVQHLFRSLSREDVIAMYRASDVALVTPLKDGMNLVAKEYCASRVNNDGALVLSEFAGAAEEFRDAAFLVNPYDIDGVAHALNNAISASHFDHAQRMLTMREMVRKYDVFSWAGKFLSAIGWEWRSYELPPRPATIWDRLRRIKNVFDI